MSTSSLAREGAQRAERQRADHVGQVAGGGVGGEHLVELVLGDRDQLDVDPALLGEGVDDLLGGGDPVGQVLDDPDRDAVAVAAATVTSSSEPHAVSEATTTVARTAAALARRRRWMDMRPP